MTLSATVVVAAEGLNLDLNGYTVSAKTGVKQLIKLAGPIAINDLSGSGTGALVAKETNGDGGSVILSWGAHRVTVYGGTLDASAVSAATHGGAVRAANMTMYGGTVKGGNTTATWSAGGALYLSNFTMYGGEVYGGKAAYGGAIAIVAGGKGNIHGGTIYAGKATYGGSIAMMASNSGKLTVTGGSIIGSSENAASGGGNIMLCDNTQMEMSGGSITGGYANNGGNIHGWSGAKLTITGGSITDGHAINGNGGNINAGSITLTIENATVSGGTATGQGQDIYPEA